MKPINNIYIYIQKDRRSVATPIDNVDKLDKPDYLNSSASYASSYAAFVDIVDFVDRGPAHAIDQGKGGFRFLEAYGWRPAAQVFFCTREMNRGYPLKTWGWEFLNGVFTIQENLVNIISNPHAESAQRALGLCGQGLRQLANGDARYHGKF